MNEEIDPQLDPEEEARVQALLADLGEAPDADLPPEVAARLDQTLAGLVAERTTAPERTATVVPLRRRWASRAAAAAAAVIVVGAGGVAAANLGVFDGNGDSTTTADAGAGSSAAESQTGPQTESASPPGSAPSDSLLRRDLPQLTAAGFESQVTTLVDNPQALRQSLSANQRKAQEDHAGADAAVGGCLGPADEDAQHVAVLYDGRPAALLVHPADDGKRLAEAWTCSGDRLLDSTTVPAARPTPGQTTGQSDPDVASPSPTP